MKKKKHNFFCNELRKKRGAKIFSPSFFAHLAAILAAVPHLQQKKDAKKIRKIAGLTSFFRILNQEQEMPGRQKAASGASVSNFRRCLISYWASPCPRTKKNLEGL